MADRRGSNVRLMLRTHVERTQPPSARRPTCGSCPRRNPGAIVRRSSGSMPGAWAPSTSTRMPSPRAHEAEQRSLPIGKHEARRARDVIDERELGSVRDRGFDRRPVPLRGRPRGNGTFATTTRARCALGRRSRGCCGTRCTRGPWSGPPSPASMGNERSTALTRRGRVVADRDDRRPARRRSRPITLRARRPRGSGRRRIKKSTGSPLDLQSQLAPAHPAPPWGRRQNCRD